MRPQQPDFDITIGRTDTNADYDVILVDNIDQCESMRSVTGFDGYVRRPVVHWHQSQPTRSKLKGCSRFSFCGRSKGRLYPCACFGPSVLTTPPSANWTHYGSRMWRSRACGCGALP